MAHINIDEVDFIEECNDYEIQNVIKWLIDNEYISKTSATIQSSHETEWNNTVSKLFDSKHLLTNEEEDLILKITSKL